MRRYTFVAGRHSGDKTFAVHALGVCGSGADEDCGDKLELGLGLAGRCVRPPPPGRPGAAGIPAESARPPALRPTVGGRGGCDVP